MKKEKEKKKTEERQAKMGHIAELQPEVIRQLRA